MNYITDTKFFNTGYIPNDANKKREKQGLDSQFISNACLQYMKSSNEQNLPYFNTMYYPVKATPLPTYGQKPISSNPQQCPCVAYIHAP